MRTSLPFAFLTHSGGRFSMILATSALCLLGLAMPAQALRLDVDVSSFRSVGIDDTLLDDANADQTDPATENETDEADVTDQTSVVATAQDDAETADADTPSDSEPTESETALFGDLPEPQSPQLLWRFWPLLTEKTDETDAAQDEPDVLEHLSHIPLTRTPRVERHIRYFQTSHHDHFDQWLIRLNHYRSLVQDIFAQFELPSDLVCLSLVESGFNPRAYSRARATGPWQFMKGTAKLYGLRVDDYVDERRDPIKSTVAAARYLRDLYDLFGAWPLAMAAYNAGEGKVFRALKKAKAQSFWEIAQTKFIRRETREYVPRFMAAAIIAKNPEQYGFSEAPPDVHQFDEVVVFQPVHLRALAVATGVPYAELHRLNPELRKDVTPPGDMVYHLKVPAGSRESIEPLLVTIKPWTPPAVVHAKNGRGKLQTLYRVRSGDNLSTIAKRFRVTVEKLKTHNHLDGSQLRPGEVLTISR